MSTPKNIYTDEDGNVIKQPDLSNTKTKFFDRNLAQKTHPNYDDLKDNVGNNSDEAYNPNYDVDGLV